MREMWSIFAVHGCLGELVWLVVYLCSEGAKRRAGLLEGTSSTLSFTQRRLLPLSEKRRSVHGGKPTTSISGVKGPCPSAPLPGQSSHSGLRFPGLLGVSWSNEIFSGERESPSPGESAPMPGPQTDTFLRMQFSPFLSGSRQSKERE